MISSKAQNPNCMYLWMDHMIAPKTQATVAEGFGEAPANLEGVRADEGPGPLHRYHADDESWWEDVYYSARANCLVSEIGCRYKGGRQPYTSGVEC